MYKVHVLHLVSIACVSDYLFGNSSVQGGDYMTKKEKVKRHLLEHGSITSWEAIMKYNATRLSDIIFCLRKAGYDIETIYKTKKNREGETITYGEYKLKTHN